MLCSAASVASDTLTPVDCSPSSVCGILQARILEWVAMCSSREIFLTQELNPYLQHLLHCRQVLFPLSHLGSPSHIIQQPNYLSIAMITCGFYSSKLRHREGKETSRLLPSGCQKRDSKAGVWKLECVLIATRLPGFVSLWWSVFDEGKKQI